MAQSSADDEALDRALTAEVDAWLRARWDPSLPVAAWWQCVAAAGWTTPHWPTQWGGRGLPRRAQHLVREEFRRFGALPPPGGLGLLMAAPTILTHGTPEQIARHVPRIVDGSVGWCQLFSEPGAGSDLAGLRTRAERDGDRWIITGQKVWSSHARQSDYGMLLARTASDRPKHAGISWFAFRLDQPGVDIRPLREATGHAIFNEVFLEEAVVDDADLIGGEGNGWSVTQSTLMFERTGIGAGGGLTGFPYAGPKNGMLDLLAGDAAALEPPPLGTTVLTLSEIVELLRSSGRANEPVLRQKLARLASLVRIGEWTAQRARALGPAAAAAGFANIGKLAQSKILKLSAELALDISGPSGAVVGPGDAPGARYAEAIVFSTASSIYGGTDEIQHNVIGERVLGLPREPDPDRHRPFASAGLPMAEVAAPRHDALPKNSFWSLVDARAKATPDAVAFEDETDRTVTFSEFRSLAESVAAGLFDSGVRPGMRISWQLPTCIDTAVLMAALSRLSVLQNPIIPVLREREVRYILSESRADVFIVRPVWRGFDHGQLAQQLAGELGFHVLATDELPEGDPRRLPAVCDPGADLRWLFYTSGSTADPKGALHTDASAMAGMNAWLEYMCPTLDDVLPIAFPIAHIGGIAMIAAAQVVGHRIVLLHTFDPVATPLVMAQHGATILGSALPFFVAYLAAQRGHGAERLFPRLRVCVNGGAPKPPTLHAEVKEVLGGTGVIGSWGLTEFPIATSGGFDDDDEQLSATEGRPAPGVEVRAVGLDGTDCAPGEEGELRLRGPQMFAGYANPTLDADAIDDRGFFRTGDLGVVAATGHVTITGRVKDIIIRNAENISASEIENLLHEHPDVGDVAVIGVPDPRTGERVCAVVAPAAERMLTLADVRAFCAERGLPSQKMPERLELVDIVPRNSMGKADKPALRRRFATA